MYGKCQFVDLDAEEVYGDDLFGSVLPNATGSDVSILLATPVPITDDMLDANADYGRFRLRWAMGHGTVKDHLAWRKDTALARRTTGRLPIPSEPVQDSAYARSLAASRPSVSISATSRSMFAQLPVEVLLDVLPYIDDYADIMSLGLTSRRLWSVVRDHLKTHLSDYTSAGKWARHRLLNLATDYFAHFRFTLLPPLPPHLGLTLDDFVGNDNGGEPTVDISTFARRRPEQMPRAAPSAWHELVRLHAAGVDATMLGQMLALAFPTYHLLFPDAAIDEYAFRVAEDETYIPLRDVWHDLYKPDWDGVSPDPRLRPRTLLVGLGALELLGRAVLSHVSLVAGTWTESAGGRAPLAGCRLDIVHRSVMEGDGRVWRLGSTRDYFPTYINGGPADGNEVVEDFRYPWYYSLLEAMGRDVPEPVVVKRSSP